MLQRLDGTLRLAESRCRLRGRVSEQEPEHDDSLLIAGESARELGDPPVGEPVERGILSRGRQAPRLRWLRLRESPTGCAEVVDGSVPRYPEEPSRERNGAVLVAVDPLQHLAERLARQILGVVAVAYAERQIRLDPVDVQAVEMRKGIAVTRATSLYEHALFGGCGRLHGPSLSRTSSPRSHPSRERGECNPAVRVG